MHCGAALTKNETEMVHVVRGLFCDLGSWLYNGSHKNSSWCVTQKARAVDITNYCIVFALLEYASRKKLYC